MIIQKLSDGTFRIKSEDKPPQMQRGEAYKLMGQAKNILMRLVSALENDPNQRQKASGIKRMISTLGKQGIY